MRLTDYFFGLPIDLYSPLGPEEVAQRINQRSKSRFNPFATGVIGWARFGRLKLEHRASIFSYNAMPRLGGKLENAEGRTRISGKFGGPLMVKIFFPVWYLVLALMFLTTTANFLGGNGDPASFVPFFLILPIFAVLPLGMHYIFTRNSQYDLEAILAFLETEVQAKPA